MPRPIRAVIDSDALRHNLAVVKHYAPGCPVFAVVKANAYGHGVARAAHALSAAEGLALLEIENALELRAGGDARRILLLGGAFTPGDFESASAHGLSVVVHSEDQVRMLGAARVVAPLDVVVKLNTGMNRLGFPEDQATSVIARLRAHPKIAALTLMTHFADADDARGVAWQVEAFERIVRSLPGTPEAAHATGAGYARTLANSAALVRYPETRQGWVRPGIMLYGCSPFPDMSAAELGLRPVMTLSSMVIAVRDLARGDRIGYGGAFEAPGAMRVGIVACGYADGYPRHAPTGTPVLVAGARTRTVGRVSMDLLFVDLTGVPQAVPGSPVVLWGEGVSADEVAASAGTVSYELLCALAPRVPVAEAA